MDGIKLFEGSHKLIDNSSRPYYSNIDIHLFTDNEMFEDNVRHPVDKFKEEFNVGDSKGYSVWFNTENKYYYGIYFDEKITHREYLLSLVAHEAVHVADMIMDCAYEQYNYGQEIQAYLVEEISFAIFSSMKIN